MRHAAIILIFVANSAVASSFSIGPNGINSKSTGLDGTGIEIGQVEPGGRSAKAGYDLATVSASNTKPAGVYFQTNAGMDPHDAHLTAHALRIAGVMIGDTTAGGVYEGVAPKANLHSAGFSGSLVDAALTLNRIATLSGANVKVRAINMSFGTEPDGIFEDVDGKSHLTQFIDWSARRHDVLYVTGWADNFIPPKLLPNDEYNGITVAASEGTDPPFDEEYTTFGAINNQDVSGGDAIGDRTTIDILAPGTDISVLNPGDDPITISGSSEAVAHVTGAVALLQQYSQQQIDASKPRFGTNSQRHEVMKAVILNSADKLSGVHGSGRDVMDSSDNKWTMSEAYNNAFIPLDDEMGAGHLNVCDSPPLSDSGGASFYAARTGAYSVSN